jgi:signal transduction histidine kinase
LELTFPPEDVDALPPAVPAGWVRSGVHPSMAQVLRCEGAPCGRVIAIIDEDSKSYAEWQSTRRPVGVKAGEVLQIDWLQSYSIGRAETSTAVYSGLQPGPYVFRISEVSLSGQPTGAETSVSLLVNAPFWQKAWFLVLCGMAVAALVLGTSRYFEWRRTQFEIARLRQQHALATERARIARDIHDDLGATLTHISMLSQPAAPESSSFTELADNLKRINHAAHVMTQAMDEIVWAANPRNDRLDHLVTFFDAYAQEFLTAAGIEFRCDFPEPVPGRPVSAPARHNLFLAFKEALANAARHAACRTVKVGMTVSADVLTLSLADDGKGFAEPSGAPAGNGLANMRRRLEELGGRCTVESAAGCGTQIVFELPLEK